MPDEWLDHTLFSPDSKSVFLTLHPFLDKKVPPAVLMLDVETGDVVRRLEGHTDRIRAAALSTDGRFFLTASDDRTIPLRGPG